MTEPDLTPADLTGMSADDILAAAKAGRIRNWTDEEKQLQRDTARDELLARIEQTNPRLHQRITKGTTK